MPNFSVLSGVYTNDSQEFLVSYPRNMIPVPKGIGASAGYLRPADGLVEVFQGPGTDRGGVLWNDSHYRVMGTRFIRIAPDLSYTDLGEVLGTDPVQFDYTTDSLLVLGGNTLHVFDGTVAIAPVGGTPFIFPLGITWLDSRVLVCDAETVWCSDISDPTTYSPGAYGDSYKDPDANKTILRMRGEAYVVGRYSIEVLQGVPITDGNFPFQYVDSAFIPRGAVGSRAACVFRDTIAFLGSGRSEPLGVYLGYNGQTSKVSTPDIDILFRGYSEAALASVVVERMYDRGYDLLFIHLPDKTLLFNASASETTGLPVWATLDSGGLLAPSQYRARNFVWVNNTWYCGDPTSDKLSRLDQTTGLHYGSPVGWEFATQLLFNESRRFIIHQIDLMTLLSGTSAIGNDPYIYTSFSSDGATWSQEFPVRTRVSIGEKNKRISWFQQGLVENWRIQRFRGLSDTNMTFVRLDVRLEGLDDETAQTY